MEHPENCKYIFVSYSHIDSDKVFDYIQRMNQDHFTLWYDENIHYSVWSASIEKALEKASVVLLFVTPNSLNSNNVFNEISFADDAKKPIFCIYLTDTNISNYSGWRLMLTKCQAFSAFKDGDEKTYEHLKKCLLPILEEEQTKTEIKPHLRFTQDSDFVTKEEAKRKARVFCIQKRFSEAKKIYDGFIADDMLDMDGYMGYIRVYSENYKKYEGTEIDEAIQIAQDICGEEDLSRFDSDYERYIEKRKKYFQLLIQRERELKYNVGNIVTYGQYWHAQNRTTGKSPIEWIVLKREGNRALLLSKYCLDCKQYNTDYAKARGAWIDIVTDTPYWWLRSPGGDPLLAAAVHYRGKVFVGGLNICVDDTAIRPAFWLNID